MGRSNERTFSSLISIKVLFRAHNSLALIVYRIINKYSFAVMKTLGFYHEVTRVDRDEYIDDDKNHPNGLFLSLHYVILIKASIFI